MQFDVFVVLAFGTVAFHVAVIGLDCAGAAAVWTCNFQVSRLSCWKRAYLVMTFCKSLSCLTLAACPFTTLENCFRKWSLFQSPYEGTFVGHYASWFPLQLDLILTLFLMATGCFAVVKFVSHRLSQQPDCRSSMRTDSSNEGIA